MNLKRISHILMSSLLMGLFFTSSGIASSKGSLKIYCGSTMLHPMKAIAKEVEAKYNCKKIKIMKGGSGSLMKQLLKKQDGDMYLPGSDTYISKLESEHAGYVLHKANVGVNQAALFVKTGNPKGIATTLDSLTGRYNVLIGDPAKGSIGKETKKILEKKGILGEVMGSAKLTTESKALTQALKTGEADVTINWFAVSTWPENSTQVETFPIDSQYATPKKLVLAVLKSSDMQELAKQFLDYAASEKGKAIFKKYGLYQD